MTNLRLDHSVHSLPDVASRLVRRSLLEFRRQGDVGCPLCPLGPLARHPAQARAVLNPSSVLHEALTLR